MKKVISLTLIAVMVLSMSLFMASCGGSGGDNAKAQRVTAVVNSSIGDKSFIDSAKTGLDQLEAEGYKTNIIECNMDQSLFEQNLRTAADNSDVVIAIGPEFSFAGKVALDYPDVKFIWIDSQIENPEKYPNLTCVSYKQNEGSYLVGYIAGKMTKTGVVGFVGGLDIPVINDFRVGYEAGAKAANPDVKVIHNFTNSFVDANAGAECGQALAAQKADIIFCAAGASGNGVILKAEELNIKTIGVDQDQRDTMRDYSDYIICSMIKEVGKSLYDYIKAFTADESAWLGGTIYEVGPEGGYISVSYGPKDLDVLVPQDIIDDMDGLVGGIGSGDIKVPSAL